MHRGNNSALTYMTDQAAFSTRKTTRTLADGLSAPPSRLRELPGAPSGSSSRAIPQELTARLRHAAEQGVERSTEWRLTGWLEGIPVGALRDSTVAIAVGAGLAVHRGLDFAWQMPLLLLAGIAFLLVGGRILIPARRWARFAADGGSLKSHRTSKADASTDWSVSPQRLGTSLVAAGCVCFVPLILVSGTPLVVIGAASGAAAVVVLSGLMPFAVRSQAETLARFGLTTAIVAAVVLSRGGSLTIDVVVASLQLGLLAALLGAVDNLRELARDRKIGRKTLAACFGVPVGRFEVGLLCLMPPVMGVAWVIGNAWGAALLPLAALPLAAWIIRDVNLLLPGPLLDSVRPRAAAIQLAFGGLLAVGLAL